MDTSFYVVDELVTLGDPMLQSAIPAEFALHAIALNRSLGTLVAWRFLSKVGVSDADIFELLKDAPGPENWLDSIHLEGPRQASRQTHLLLKD